MPFTRYHSFLLALVLGVLIWSGIAPLDRLTWAMEVAPVLIALPILLLTARRFPLTDRKSVV